MEAVQRDYAPLGVQFVYVYKALAHPELNGFVKPFTLEERLMQTREAERRLGSRFLWICDTLENDWKHAFGDAPNSEFVLDPQGVVARRRVWSDPAALREDLETLVGPVENPTRAEDLNLPQQPPPSAIATGVAPRVRTPGPMRPLRIEPRLAESPLPFYAKLRAEVEPAVLAGKPGSMYIGFHLDPLYKVHWNNLTDPLRFEAKPPTGMRLTPSSGEGPKLELEADADPREFLLEIDPSGGDLTRPIELTVRYFACDDAQTFCVPVTQSYAVWIEEDPDGGMARRGRNRAPNANSPTLPPDFMERIRRMDANGDKRIDRREARGPLKIRFDQLDRDGDGQLDAEELAGARERIERSRRPRPQNRGSIRE